MVFRAVGAFDPACGPYAYAWRFSDGTLQTGWQVFKTFNDPGVHSVELTINTPRQTLNITSVIGIGVKPFSLFATPQNAAGPTSTFRFEAVPSGNADFGQWIWNFGDGTVIGTKQMTVSHSYAKSGAYVVTLSAANAVPTEAVRVMATVTAIPKRRASGR
jgi:PKD repeat protein